MLNLIAVETSSGYTLICPALPAEIKEKLKRKGFNFITPDSLCPESKDFDRRLAEEVAARLRAEGFIDASFDNLTTYVPLNLHGYETNSGRILKSDIYHLAPALQAEYRKKKLTFSPFDGIGGSGGPHCTTLCLPKRPPRELSARLMGEALKAKILEKLDNHFILDMTIFPTLMEQKNIYEDPIIIEKIKNSMLHEMKTSNFDVVLRHLAPDSKDELTSGVDSKKKIHLLALMMRTLPISATRTLVKNELINQLTQLDLSDEVSVVYLSTINKALLFSQAEKRSLIPRLIAHQTFFHFPSAQNILSSLFDFLNDRLVLQVIEKIDSQDIFFKSYQDFCVFLDRVSAFMPAKCFSSEEKNQIERRKKTVAEKNVKALLDSFDHLYFRESCEQYLEYASILNYSREKQYAQMEYFIRQYLAHRSLDKPHQDEEAIFLLQFGSTQFQQFFLSNPILFPLMNPDRKPFILSGAVQDRLKYIVKQTHIFVRADDMRSGEDRSVQRERVQAIFRELGIKTGHSEKDVFLNIIKSFRNSESNFRKLFIDAVNVSDLGDRDQLKEDIEEIIEKDWVKMLVAESRMCSSSKLTSGTPSSYGLFSSGVAALVAAAAAAASVAAVFGR